MPDLADDLILDVLEGRKDVPIEQLRVWRDDVASRVMEWAQFRASERASSDLADAHRARMLESIARGQESAELILGRLDNLISATEIAP